MTPRAITGFGICSALGIGREAFFEALRNPVPLSEQPKRPVTMFDTSAYPDARAVEVPEFDPTKYVGDKGLRTLDRLTKLLIVAGRLATHDAGLKKDGQWAHGSGDRFGLCCSNAYGSLEAITELDRVAVLEDRRYINPSKFPNTVANSASGYASIWEDLRALNVSVSDGNCGALDVFPCADIYLETERADAVLVGGAESLSEAIFLAFQRLGAIDAGSWIGEGAALFVTEPMEKAKARDARILARVHGASTAFVAPENDGQMISASGEAMQRAVRGALEDAGVEPGQVDLVVSGVAGLRVFDNTETGALRKVLGEGVPICAPKAIYGETLGAGGAMATAAGIAYLQGAPPRPLVSGRLERPVRTVLVTSMGYYGNATAVVLSAP
jgi:3-oxoacyl-[acyl-carrier-protein] synthase II